jgi:NAD-dependent dihydropyrimidine dehydrogenase PreA subunit
MSGLARGNIEINIEECKGCGLCVESCPPKCLALADELSAYGVHPALYAGDGCTGCGICFYCCPEPGADHRLPHGSAAEASRGIARRATCAGSVRAMWP